MRRTRSRRPGSGSRTSTIVKASQTYARLDEFTYRYSSGEFAAELTVDDDGLVAAYAAWQRTGFAMGPDDTEPLDGLH